MLRSEKKAPKRVQVPEEARPRSLPPPPQALAKAPTPPCPAGASGLPAWPCYQLRGTAGLQAEIQEEFPGPDGWRRTTGRPTSGEVMVLELEGSSLREVKPET